MSVAVAEQTGCNRCGSPLEDGDLRCAVCALPVAVRRALVERVRVQVLRCTWCGAAVGFDANHQSPKCGFCSSVMVVEQPIDPVEVATLRVPFAVDREQATATLRRWLGSRGYFAPATLRDEAVLESLTPLCWAAWIVSAQAKVAWTADSDQGSRRSDWAPHAGELEHTFDNIIIPASRGLHDGECVALAHFYDVSRAVSVSAPELAAEVSPMIESFDTQRSAARKRVHRAIERLAAKHVRKHEVPGRRVRNVHVSCLLERQTTARVALPVWILAYRYRGSPYRALIHGQYADLVFGHSPLDWRKIARLAGGIALAILAVVAAVLLLTARG